VPAEETCHYKNFELLLFALTNKQEERVLVKKGRYGDPVS
jgi:hypothetical protein